MIQDISYKTPQELNADQLSFSIRQARRAACKHDNIEETAQFVVFSEENPYSKFLDILMNEYFRRIQK